MSDEYVRVLGNVTKVVDPEGRDAAMQAFDLADNKLRTESIDAGNSISVFDAAGISVETRDAKGGLSLKRADNLGRTTHVWGRDQTGESVRLCERVIFGDAAGGPSSPKAHNHLGKPYRHYDEAGRVNFVSYDFKGNQIEQTRRVIDPQHMIDAYNAADSSTNWEVDTYRVDWTTSSGQTLGDRASQLLKPRDYTVTKAYDGLDRAHQIHYPADKNGHRALAEPAYNKAGNLQSVTLDGNAYVERIAYNPRGQRILAALGNGAMVRYAYDDVTFRLERLRSEGYTKPDQATYSPDGPVHQDFTYTYDAAGNITELESYGDNVGTGTDNDTLTRQFVYDALYRLTDATGREFNALDGNGDPTISKSEPWQDNGGNSGNGDNTRPYAEHYSYDDVGNMTELVHEYGKQTTQWDGSFNFQQSGSWSRDFNHEGDSNQLDTMTDGGGTTRSYTYDAAGNLTKENSNRKHEWDWGGRMRSFRDQVSGSQATVFAHYTYDSGGQRTQKVVCKDNGDPVHTVYIGGIYEHHEKITSGSVTAENNFLHIMDDSKRVAIKRIGPHLDGTNPANIQYHLGDHLQSSSVVLDGAGNYFNREEYRPYGETSFGSYDKKRYRFTGQERDEESGLNYHGARYYAPWAATWTAPDPKGMVDGLGLFRYSQSNPVNLLDPSGTQSKAPRPLTPSDFQNVSQDHSRVPYLRFSYTPITGPQQPPGARPLPKSRRIVSTLESFQESGASQQPKSVERSGVVHINEKDGSVTVYQLTENETATLRSTNSSKSSSQDPSSPDPSDRLMAIRQRKKKPSGSLNRGTLIPWHTHPTQSSTGRIFSGNDLMSIVYRDTNNPSGQNNMRAASIITSGTGTFQVEAGRSTETEASSFIRELAAKHKWTVTEFLAASGKQQRAEIEAAGAGYRSYAETQGLSKGQARAYARLTLAHKLGLKVKRYSKQKGKFVKIDLSTRNERIEAAKNMVPGNGGSP